MLYVQATAVFENLDSGEILCAACPNSRVVITAGTSSVSGAERTQQIYM